NAPSIADQAYPEFDEELLKEDVFEYPVSFNGKLRFRLELPLSMPEDDIREAVITHETAQKWLSGGEPVKIIIVKGRIINVVL
ncbi:MAG: hypothetical protein KAT15_22045, partial [Bacteroidales bacterium]|nr:hypothetical protein [Bacteroidales bacterium]